MTDNIVTFDKNRKKSKPDKSKSAGKDGAKYHKAEGERMLKIKERKDHFVKTLKDAQEAARLAHKELWDEVHKQLPDTDPKRNYRIDTEYEDLGFYVVKEDDSNSGIPAGLMQMLKDILE